MRKHTSKNGPKIPKEEAWKHKLVFLTDRSLLNEFCRDRTLKRYSCIIIDEAHERTVFTDILLAELKQLSRKEGKMEIH